jgi:CBS domain-containing protein
LREVAEVLSAYHIGGLPVVVAGGRVGGVISASDLIDFVANSPGVPVAEGDDVEWGEIGEASDEPDDNDADASTYFADLWTDAGTDVLERFRVTDGPEWNPLEEHTAEEVMDPRAVQCFAGGERRGSSAHHACARGVHRLLVVSDRLLEGVW